MTDTQAEIEEAYEKWEDEYVGDASPHWSEIGADEESFTAGYLAGQAKLIEKASEGFDEWKDRLTSGGNYQVNRLDLHEQTWTAAKFSAFRDVNFTNEQYLALEERLKEAEHEMSTAHAYLKSMNLDPEFHEPEYQMMIGFREFLSKHKGEKGGI